MRMVADFMEMEGWDTYYLGANTPTESVFTHRDSQKERDLVK
jgi:methanogenic corrinoid protein MtbC1